MLSLAWLMMVSIEQPASCSLTAAEKQANALLSFQQFDQDGVTSSTSRKLSERGCHAQAVEATEDYLINGPLPTDRQQRIISFHLGQSLASAGREQEAAHVIAGTRHPPVEGAPSSPLKWNDFVSGVWAFLVKDRPVLRRSIQAIKAGEGHGNALNASMLEAMDRCFAQPYAKAIVAPCRVLPPETK